MLIDGTNYAMNKSYATRLVLTQGTNFDRLLTTAALPLWYIKWPAALALGWWLSWWWLLLVFLPINRAIREYWYYRAVRILEANPQELEAAIADGLVKEAPE